MHRSTRRILNVLVVGLLLAVMGKLAWVYFVDSPERLIYRLDRQRGSWQIEYQRELADKLYAWDQSALDALMDHVGAGGPYHGRGDITSMHVLLRFGDRAHQALQDRITKCRQSGSSNVWECRNFAEANIMMFNDLTSVDDWIEYYNIDHQGAVQNGLLGHVFYLIDGSGIPLPSLRGNMHASQVNELFVRWWEEYRDQAIQWSQNHPQEWRAY